MSTTDEERVRALIAQVLAENPPASTPTEDFLQARYDAGLAWTWFPEGFGGLGLSPKMQTIADHAFEDAGAPNTRAGAIGYMMTGSAIATHGSDELKRRFLPLIYRSGPVWCQLFSEPGAGSDIAGLATRAIRDGDEWLVNGQKVWSSGAMSSDWGLLIARTDPDVPKHDGMTMFLLDMHQPDVEIRPLRNIAGTAHFAETFFSNARVADANRIGAVGEGWRVVLTTLMAERLNFNLDVAGAGAPRPGAPMERARELFIERGRHDPARREEFMRVWSMAEIVRLGNRRADDLAKAGNPGPEGSIGKVTSTELTKKVANLTMSLLGADALVLDHPYAMPGEDHPRFEGAHWDFLASPSNTIMGGTSEIQRNNIAERVLGLPSDVRLDKGIPWRDVPRNG